MKKKKNQLRLMQYRGVRMNEKTNITVSCTGCSQVSEYPKGYLTQSAEKEYKCSVCRNKVVENQVQDRARGNREVLTD